jgi:acetylornithine/succinyldiaminopimelate/putrescine aminotransferase
MDRALPVNTGLEAVETALKAARKWAYAVKGVPHDCAEIIACEGKFHGRSIAITGPSSEAQYRQGFGPFSPGLRLVPYGDIAALERAITPHTAELGVRLMSGLGAIASPLVQDVRGKGLLVGVEIDPARASARRVVEGLLARGVLSKETHGTVVRFAPPLVIEPEEIDVAVEALRDALAEIERAG